MSNWASIAPEIRPSANKNADGTLKPFFLKLVREYRLRAFAPCAAAGVASADMRAMFASATHQAIATFLLAQTRNRSAKVVRIFR